MLHPLTLPPQQELKARLHYDPETGELRTLSNYWRPTKPKRGYRAVAIAGKRYKAHRVIWKWMTGEEPVGDIDHVNGDKTDNRWANLRLATRSQNMANLPARKSRLLPKGVSLCKQTGRYQAQITIQGKSKKIGRFDTVEDAAAAYASAAREFFGEFARTA